LGAPRLVGVDDQARIGSAPADGGDARLIAFARQLELEQRQM